MAFVFEDEPSAAPESRFVFEPPEKKPNIFSRAVTAAGDWMRSLPPPATLPTEDLFKTGIEDVSKPIVQTANPVKDLSERANAFMLDLPSKVARADQALATRFPGATATLNRIREGLTPDLMGAAESIRQVPAESRRLSETLTPIFGKAGEAIAPYAAGARALVSAPFTAATPRVVGETLGPALQTVGETAGRASEALGLPKPVTGLIREFAPDAVMIAAFGAFDRALRTGETTPEQARIFIEQARDVSRPMGTMSPTEATAVGNIARASSDAHIAAALRALRENDPRYEIYQAEQARRATTPATPQAGQAVAESAPFQGPQRLLPSPERAAAIAKGQARVKKTAPIVPPETPRFAMEPQVGEVPIAETQLPKVQAPEAQAALAAPTLQAAPVQPVETPTLTAPEVVAKIESQQAPEHFDKPKIEKQVTKAGETFVKTEVDPATLKVPGEKGVEPGVSAPEKGPIVVDDKGKVIDGRHRVVDAKAAGEATIQAYAPALKYSDLPDYAKGAIHYTVLGRITNSGGKLPETIAGMPYNDSLWARETVPVTSLDVPDPRTFTRRPSITKGPIVVMADGEIADGNNRLFEAAQRGDKTIEVYREIPKQAQATLQPMIPPPATQQAISPPEVPTAATPVSPGGQIEGVANEPAASLIERIVEAARRKPLPIVESRETLGSNGKWYGMGGTPVGVTLTDQTRIAGYSYLAENGTRVGTRQPTHEAAEAAQKASMAARDQEFRQALQGMSPEKLQSQATYWLKEAPPVDAVAARAAELEAENARLKAKIQPTKPQRQSSLLTAQQLSDFRPGIDRVERRGDETYVVDSEGQRADVQVRHDALTPGTRANFDKLPPARLEEFRAQTEGTPYLSKEGKAERLAILDGLIAKRNAAQEVPSATQARIAQLEAENAALAGKRSPTEPGKPSLAKPATLRRLADSMEAQIQAKLHPGVSNQAPTRRRANIAEGMYKEGQRMISIQSQLRAVADAIEAGTLPESLRSVATRSDLETMNGTFYRPSTFSNHLDRVLVATTGKRGLKDDWTAVSRIKNMRTAPGSNAVPLYSSDLDAIAKIAKAAESAEPYAAKGILEDVAKARRMAKLGIDTKEKFDQAKTDLERLTGPKPKVDETAHAIKQAENKLIGMREPGVFFTPKELADRVIEEADIQLGMKVLEPSAGKGDLADAVKRAQPEADISTIEIRPHLQDILKLKGYNVVGNDFMAEPTEPVYDRIVMNPPFENGQDIAHIQRAYNALKPGGKLVAIMSESPFFRSEKKFADFRDWMDKVGATAEKLPEKSFMGAGTITQTGTATRLLMVEKPDIAMAKTAAKEPWEMTREQWTVQRPAGTSPGMHEWEIQKALKEGKPVPPEVLADYPDLAKQTRPTDADLAARAAKTAEHQRRVELSKAQPEMTNDDRIRESMGLDKAKIDAYDPQRSIRRVGRHWSYKLIGGEEHQGLYNTRREAVEAAARHKDIKLEQFDNPSGFYDLTSLLAGERLKLIEKYQSEGMSEMDAGERARAEIPEPKIEPVQAESAPQQEPTPEPTPAQAEAAPQPEPLPANAGKIALLKRQLVDLEKARIKKSKSMGSMVPPPIRMEVMQNFAVRADKIQAQIDAIEHPPVASEPTPAQAEAKVTRAVQATASTPKEAMRVKKELASRIEALIKAAPTEAENNMRAEGIRATQPSYPSVTALKPEREIYEKAKAAWEKKHGKELERLEKGTITIEIPGDGIFKIRRTKEALEEVLTRVKGIPTAIRGEFKPKPVPIPKRRGELPADIWYDSNEPTHWITNNAGVKLKGVPIEIPELGSMDFYITSGGETYRIVEPRTGMALGEPANSIAKAVESAKESWKKQVEREVEAGRDTPVLEEAIATNVREMKAAGTLKAEPPEPITPESLEMFDRDTVDAARARGAQPEPPVPGKPAERQSPIEQERERIQNDFDRARAVEERESARQLSEDEIAQPVIDALRQVSGQKDPKSGIATDRGGSIWDNALDDKFTSEQINAARRWLIRNHPPETRLIRSVEGATVKVTPPVEEAKAVGSKESPYIDPNANPADYDRVAYVESRLESAMNNPADPEYGAMKNYLELHRLGEWEKQFRGKVEDRWFEANPGEAIVSREESVDRLPTGEEDVVLSQEVRGTPREKIIRYMLEQEQKKGNPAWSDGETIHTREGLFSIEREGGKPEFQNTLSDEGIFRQFAKDDRWISYNKVAEDMAAERAAKAEVIQANESARLADQSARLSKWRDDTAQREQAYLDSLDAQVKATKFKRGPVEISQKVEGKETKVSRDGALLTDHFAIRKPDSGQGWVISHRGTGLAASDAETIQQAKRIAVAFEGIPGAKWDFTDTKDFDKNTRSVAGETARNLKGRGRGVPDSFDPITEPPYKVGEQVIFNEHAHSYNRGDYVKASHEATVTKVHPDGTVDVLLRGKGNKQSGTFEGVLPENLEIPKESWSKPGRPPKGEKGATETADLSSASLADLIRKGFGSETGAVGKLTPEQTSLEVQARAARKEIYRRLMEEVAKTKESIEAVAERFNLPPGVLQRIQAEQSPPPPVESAIPVAPEGGFVTSIKNAQVDKELAEMGRPPATHGERLSFEDARAAAAQMVEIDPFAGQKLVDELIANMRPATKVELALLTREWTRLKNERYAVEDRLMDAQKSGDKIAIGEAKAQVEKITADVTTVADVLAQTGTESSLSLGHRRMMMKEDYSLASMERSAQVAQEGKPLTDAQRAEIKALHDKINATRKAFDDYAAKAETRRAEIESELAHERLINEERAKEQAAPGYDPHIASLAERIISAMEAQADAARARLRAKLSSLHAGLDPTIVSDMAIVGAAKIARGAVEFGRWSKAMIEDFGEKISPYLKAAWDASNKRLDDRIAKMAGIKKESVERAIKKPDVADRRVTIREQLETKIEAGADISAQAQALARSYVEQGVTNRNKLIDAVHSELKDVMPDITRRQTMDAISGYGRYKQLSRDEVSIQLRDLKGQMQQVAKLEDIQSREPPLKTGVERRTPSDEERRLIQQVNEAKRRFGVVVTDPATQLQSALGARKTYYRNQISDLEDQIKAGEKFIKEKAASPTDPELNALKAQRDELKKQFDDVFGKPGLTDQQRVARAIQAAAKSITDLEQRVKAGDIAPRTRLSRTPSTPELEAMRAHQDALREQIRELRDAATPHRTPEEIALQTLKTRLKNQTAKLLDRMARGDFTEKPKRVIVLDPEARTLSFEAAKVKAEWNERLMKIKLANRTAPQKIIGGVGEVLNTSRAILTGLDLSAVLRQGAFMTYGHPVRAARSFPAMLRALRSEKGEYAVNQEILSRENYPLYKRSKLYLAEQGQTLAQMEEAYMTRWAHKIPLVAGSQRAYTTFLNKLRADSFDAMVNALGRNGSVTQEEASAIANFINVNTGRGDVGARASAMVGLNTIFFAPRYVLSRFQLLTGQPFYRGTARTRTLIAKEYARFLIGIGMVYGLATMSGADVEIDPRSSDFGKIKIGNTRVDPLAGLSQATVLLSRLATGETKTLRGKIFPIRGEKVPYRGQTTGDVMGRFLRSKLSPAFGTGVNILTGKDYIGDPVTPESITTNLVVPLAMQDIYDAMKDQGVPAGAALGILAVFGMGMQTFDERKKRVPDRSTFGQRWGLDFQENAVNE